MKRFLQNLGAAVLLLIPITAILVMFEIVTFPGGHRYMGHIIVGYLAIVLVLLLREIVVDVLVALGWRKER